MPEIDRHLIEEIASETDVPTGVMTSLSAIAQTIREQPTNARALVKLADDIDQQKFAIAQAVVANTGALPDPAYNDERALLAQTLESERYLRKDAEETLAKVKAQAETDLRRAESDLEDEHNLRLDLEKRLAALEKEQKKSDAKAKPLTGEGKGA